MDIDGLGEVLINQLVDRKLVGNVSDLYSLKTEQLAGLDRMGEKSAVNVVQSISASRGRDLWRLIFSLGIMHVGEGAARKLADSFKTMDALSVAKADDFQRVADIGPVLAVSLVDFFANDRNRDVLERLRLAGVNFLNLSSPSVARGGTFSGKTVVITGTLSCFTRDSAQEELRKRGAKVTDSVSKKTHYLIAGAEAGTKLDKARRLHVSILSEDEFKAMLET